MASKQQFLSSALEALSKVQDRIDEADEDQLKELDTLAWQIHDDVIGA